MGRRFGGRHVKSCSHSAVSATANELRTRDYSNWHAPLSSGTSFQRLFDASMRGAEMSDPIRRFSYIDALRGYAILMVIEVHTSQLFSDLPGPLATILNQGARGVQLFFVTSAFTLSMSWVARNETTADFFTRRLFRIAPMFWIAIIFYLWLNGTGSVSYTHLTLPTIYSV